MAFLTLGRFPNLAQTEHRRKENLATFSNILCFKKDDFSGEVVMVLKKEVAFQIFRFPRKYFDVKIFDKDYYGL